MPRHTLPRSAHLPAGVLLLVACHRAGPPAAVPTDFSMSPFREPPETLALASSDQEAIYRVVLRFYRPAGDQVRWLNRETLPSAPAGATTTLDLGLAVRLIQPLASARFCLQDGPADCPGASGGVLRVSEIYGQAPGRARLVVHFQGVAGPYAPGTAYSGTEAFLVAKRGDTWQILTHSPAAP